MNKVTVEITDNGWTTTVEINGKKFVEKHKKTRFGAESTKGNFENQEEISEELYEAVSSGFYAYNVMLALKDC